MLSRDANRRSPKLFPFAKMADKRRRESIHFKKSDSDKGFLKAYCAESQSESLLPHVIRHIFSPFTMKYFFNTEIVVSKFAALYIYM